MWTSRGELASGGRQMLHLSELELEVVVMVMVLVREQVVEVEKDEGCVWDRGLRKVERSMLYNLRFGRA